MDSITETFRQIWELADELAEGETQQFEKKPYKAKTQGLSKDGRVTVVYRNQSRAAYKDDKRQKHILEMLDTLTNIKEVKC